MERSDENGREARRDEPEHADLAALLAKEAIREALYDELDAWRRRDWLQMRAGFVASAQVEGELFGSPSDARTSLSVGDRLAQLAEAMRTQAASSLVVSNCRIELSLDGASARVSSLVLAAHEPRLESGERTRLEALRFDDEWIDAARGADGRIWKVASRRVETLWQAWLDPRRDDRVGDHRHAVEWTR